MNKFYNEIKEFFENPTNERIKDFLNKVLNK